MFAIWLGLLVLDLVVPFVMFSLGWNSFVWSSGRGACWPAWAELSKETRSFALKFFGQLSFAFGLALSIPSAIPVSLAYEKNLDCVVMVGLAVFVIQVILFACVVGATEVALRVVFDESGDRRAEADRNAIESRIHSYFSRAFFFLGLLLSHLSVFITVNSYRDLSCEAFYRFSEVSPSAAFKYGLPFAVLAAACYGLSLLFRRKCAGRVVGSRFFLNLSRVFAAAAVVISHLACGVVTSEYRAFSWVATYHATTVSPRAAFLFLIPSGVVVLICVGFARFFRRKSRRLLKGVR